MKREIKPRPVPMIAEQISMLITSTMPDAIPVMAAAYLSPRTREILDDLEVGYIDTLPHLAPAKVSAVLPRASSRSTC